MVVKVLVCGPVKEQWLVLCTRLIALQKSAAGPFHALFLVEPYESLELHSIFKSDESTLDFPLPVYVFSSKDVLPSSPLPNKWKVISESADVGLKTVCGLTVAFFSSSASFDDPGLQRAKDICQSTGYRGCDILLSHGEWPLDVHQFVDPSLPMPPEAGAGSGSQPLASFAQLVKPRYHFAGGRDVYYQRPPYANPASTSGLPAPATRFIGLATVSEIKDKDRKWLHALSLEPIVYLPDSDIADIPAGCTDCPYISIRQSTSSSISSSTLSTSPVAIPRPPPPPNPPGSSADSYSTSTSDLHPSKRPKLDSVNASASASASGLLANRFASLQNEAPTSGAFFFGHMGASRSSAQSSSYGSGGTGVLPTSNLMTPPSNSACVLFVGGLSRDTRDRDLLQELPGAKSVRRIEGKPFAFVTFISHEAAVAIMAASQKSPVVLGGRSVTLGWSKEKDRELSSHQQLPKDLQVETQPPSPDAVTLYVGGLPAVYFSDELSTMLPGLKECRPVLGKSYCFVDMQSHSDAEAAIMNASRDALVLRGQRLAVGWARQGQGQGQTQQTLSDPPGPDSRILFVGNVPVNAGQDEVTQLLRCGSEVGASDPVSVQKPQGKGYAFVEFSSHSEAASSLQRYLQRAGSDVQTPCLRLGWARGRAAERPESGSIDCWFCLGSATVKIHLVLSVGEHSYLALPRGALIYGHVLIVPIDCVPSRLLLSSDAKRECARYEAALSKYYLTNINGSGGRYLLFERTLRTRGGRDHMQINLIPLSSDMQCAAALSAFSALAQRYGVTFSQLRPGEDVEEAVLAQTDGPSQEYFYIQLPVAVRNRDASGITHLNFVYVPPANNSGSGSGPPRFPLSFGLEVAAEALGIPERANWKMCAVSDDEEMRQAEAFKGDFAPFDFAT